MKDRHGEPAAVVRRDLRLPLAAIGAWGAALAGLYGGARVSLAVAGGAAVLTVLALKRRRGAAAAAATIAFGAMLASGATAVHVVVRDDAHLAELVESGAGGEAEIVLDAAPRPSARSPGVHTAAARLRSFTTDTASLSGNWRVLLVASGDEWDRAVAGQAITVEGTVREADPGRLTAAIFSARSPPEFQGPPSAPHRFAAHVRERAALAASAVPQPESGLIPALAVGDTSGMDPTLESDFRSTGLVHLVVVSGYHVGLVVGTVLGVATALRAGPGVRVAIGAAAVAGIVVVVGPQPSVLRAAVMAGMMLLALAAGRPRAALPALATAVLVLVLADPDLAAQPGFALSVAACAGLLLLAFRWARPLEHRGWPLPVALAATIPAATQVAVTPLLVAWAGEVSLVSIPVNLLAALVAAPVVVLSVLTAAVAAAWTSAGEWCAKLAAIPARWLVWLAETGADVPGGTLPWPTGLWWSLLAAAILAVLVGLLHVRRLRRPLLAIGAAAALGAVPSCLATGPPSGWVVTMCDVGQGDTIVLPAGDGVVVVDTGPEPAAVDECLDGLGVDRIALLVLSHFHIDHSAGIGGVVGGREVDAILAPPPGEATYGHDLVVERAGDLPFLEPEPGRVHRFGATSLEVLWPLPNLMEGTRSDPNNNSVAVRADVAGTSVLLTGDIEVEAQARLLESGANLDVDVLKVPHHGSAFQVPEFLERTDPVVALVGVGADNDYGHPDPGPLALLEHSGSQVFRTDLSGDVTVAREGGRLTVRTST
ncbi:ComEC/Rec2 family competence protein [Glycomyces salinus]|uniref:ComEC/Rec2 family competence protein n=1 Tax=Glycomyces salinus TaxID=980294 RepID=UPI0018EAB4DC|nr:ComEC/Rec2 family competence protein [Glycomyces salinus]